MRWDEELYSNTVTHVPLPLIQVKSTVTVPSEERGWAKQRKKKQKRGLVFKSLIYIINNKTPCFHFNRLKIIVIKIITSLVNKT